MFGFLKTPDRYNELFQHLTKKWHMKNGYASVFLNEYRSAISKQYEKASKQTHDAFLSGDPDTLDAAYNEITEWALVGQAYHAYRSDLRAGKHLGTSIELVIWAILLVRIDLIAGFDIAFSNFLEREQVKRFPNLFKNVFNDPLKYTADASSYIKDKQSTLARNLESPASQKSTPCNDSNDSNDSNEKILSDSFTQIKSDHGLDVREFPSRHQIEHHFREIIKGTELSNFAKISLIYRLVAFHYLNDAKINRTNGVLVAKGDLEWTIDLLSQSIDWAAIHEEESIVENLAIKIDQRLVELSDFFGISRG